MHCFKRLYYVAAQCLARMFLVSIVGLGAIVLSEEVPARISGTRGSDGVWLASPGSDCGGWCVSAGDKNGVRLARFIFDRRGDAPRCLVLSA